MQPITVYRKIQPPLLGAPLVTFKGAVEERLHKDDYIVQYECSPFVRRDVVKKVSNTEYQMVVTDSYVEKWFTNELDATKHAILESLKLIDLEITKAENSAEIHRAIAKEMTLKYALLKEENRAEDSI
jgi:hypothetical protein